MSALSSFTPGGVSGVFNFNVTGAPPYTTLKTFIKDKDEIIKYDYYKYNKDIVLAYEYNFIINIDHINEYIKEQNEYLNSLSINDKYTIYDYTYNHSYTFYKNFKLNNKK